MFLGIYVDDLILVSKNTKSISKIKKNLKQKFKMKDLGKIKYFLGIEFDCDEKNHEIIMSVAKEILF